MKRESLWSMMGNPFLGCWSKCLTASRTAAGVLGVPGVPRVGLGPIRFANPWKVADVFGGFCTPPGKDNRRDVDGGTAPYPFVIMAGLCNW